MFKNTRIWIKSYAMEQLKRKWNPKPWAKPTHVMFCICDHFEPEWNKANLEIQRQRVDRWISKYPELVRTHRDADGCHPKHTFFYPAECYQKEHLEKLRQLVKKGIAEVEIHLHHKNDTALGLRKKLIKAKEDFTRHQLLGTNKLTGQTAFAFIHGNWALNNSRPDRNWCGVNKESPVLKRNGCYADFTLPSAPSPTQTRIINSIYYPTGNERKPKSHNVGIPVTAGKPLNGRLMIIQGPLTLNWQKKKSALFPRIENSDIHKNNPPTISRINLWVEQRICVRNKEDWIFIKVHTHGAQEANMKILHGPAMERMFVYLEHRYNDGKNFVLHYVSAREMFNIIRAAERGLTENPGSYRNYLIVPNIEETIHIKKSG